MRVIHVGCVLGLFIACCALGWIVGSNYSAIEQMRIDMIAMHMMQRDTSAKVEADGKMAHERVSSIEETIGYIVKILELHNSLLDPNRQGNTEESL